MQEWERTTDVETRQFVEFIQFVVQEGLTDEVLTHLESKGFDQIRVSVQPIRAIQDFVKDRYKNSTSPKAGIVTMSAHIDGSCG